MPPDKTVPITAVVFAYRQAPLVEAAVRSVFAQTVQPAEIILSDDASPDETFEVMQRVAQEYRGPAEIRLRRTDGASGWFSHINACCRIARHPWVLVFAGDDISRPNRVARFYEEIENDAKAALIWSWMERMGADGTLTGRKIGIDAYPPGSLRGVGASQAWRRDLFTEFGDLPHVEAAEDIVLPFRAWLLDGLRFIPEPLVDWRDRDYRKLRRDQLDWAYERRATVFRVNAARVLMADLNTFEEKHPERRADLAPVRAEIERTLRGAEAEEEVLGAASGAGRLGRLVRAVPRLGFKRARRIWQEQVLGLPSYLEIVYPRMVRRLVPQGVALVVALAVLAGTALPWVIRAPLALALALLGMEAARMGLRFAARKMWRPA